MKMIKKLSMKKIHENAYNSNTQAIIYQCGIPKDQFSWPPSAPRLGPKHQTRPLALLVFLNRRLTTNTSTFRQLLTRIDP